MLLSVFLLGGCWDQRELSTISVVTGMAVDKGDNAKYILTIEGINAQELIGKTATGFTPSVIFKLEGETLAELAQKMNVGVSRNPIYSHMRTFIIDEEVAKEGLLEFLDYLERNREIRDDFNIVVAHNVKAAEVLKVSYPFQKSSSLKLFTQLRSVVQNWGGDPAVRLNDLIQALTSPGRQPVMAAVTIQGNPDKGNSVDNMKKISPDALVVLDSLAVFKNKKLIGYLSLEDTRNYLWIEDKLKRTSLSVPCAKNRYFTALFYNSKTRSKARMVNGRPFIHLKVRAEAYLDGIQCLNDLSKVKTYGKLEKLAAKKIKQNLSSTIKKVQEEYQSDIFGFGEMVYRQDYHNFKKVENHWDDYFKDAVITFDVKVNLRRSGIRTKSLLSDQK